jgi:anti-anti-sigma regulatory factor
MQERAKIMVARFADGVSVHLEGAGTMAESPLVNAFAEEVMRDRTQRVIVDLAGCTYLDSTFLGGLVSLMKRHGEQRFAIYAPADQRRLLFSVSRLDQLLPFVTDPPPAAGEQDLSLEVVPHASKEELGQYIVDCHRRLAELGGAEAQDFSRVADALENELRTPTNTRS